MQGRLSVALKPPVVALASRQQCNTPVYPNNSIFCSFPSHIEVSSILVCAKLHLFEACALHSVVDPVFQSYQIKYSMICETCRVLPIQDSSFNWMVPHYTSFVELDESSKNGCSLCTLFKTVVLEYYAKSLACSVEEAESYHRSLDKFNLAARCKDDESSSFGDDRGGQENAKGTEDEEDVDEKECKQFGSSFLVIAGWIELDSRFVALEQGLHSLNYIRQANNHDEVMAIRDVYPALHISCPDGNISATSYGISLTFYRKCSTFQMEYRRTISSSIT
jgi:hypothetical protein